MKNEKKKRKKILFIMQLPPPVHGSSMMNKYVADSVLLQNRFVTEVINLQFAKNIREIEKFQLRKLVRMFYYATQIWKRVFSFRPDLVYFTIAPRGFAFYRDLLFAILLKLSGMRIVYHLHGKGIGRTAGRNVVNRLLCRWIFKDEEVICLSQKLTLDIQRFYEGKAYIVPNGIPALTTADAKRTEDQRVPQVLYLSNYIPEKGILVLIDALKLLRDEGHDFRTRLVGAPGKLTIPFLETHLAQLGLQQQVTVVGPRYGEDKVREFRQADIFVFPTYYANEAFPLVNLEAMQFGLPIISTDEGGIPDMFIDGEAGFIVQPHNARMLADKMRLLLTDPQLRTEMGKKGCAYFATHYTIDQFEQNLSKIFSDILVKKATEKVPSAASRRVSRRAV